MDINFCIFVGACLLEPWSSLPDSPLSLFSSLFLDLSLWPWRALYRTPRRHGEDVANWIVYITVAAQYIARRSGNPTKQGTWISARLSYAGAGLTDHAGFVCTNEATRCRSEYFTLPLSISLINIAIFPPFFFSVSAANATLSKVASSFFSFRFRLSLRDWPQGHSFTSRFRLVHFSWFQQMNETTLKESSNFGTISENERDLSFAWNIFNSSSFLNT